MPLEDGCLMTLMTWSIELIRHSLRLSLRSPSIEVSYVVGGKLQRIQGTPRSLGVFQDPDASSMGGGWDHVKSLPYHIERTRKDLVRQVDAQLH